MSFASGYLALGTGASLTFVEATAAGYARQPATFSTQATDVFNVFGGEFGPFTAAPGALTQLALYDAQTAGNLLLWWPVSLGSPAVNDPFSYGAGAFRIRVPALLPGAVALYQSGSAIGTSVFGEPVLAGMEVTVSNGTLTEGDTIGNLPVPPSPTVGAVRVVKGAFTVSLADLFSTIAINVASGGVAGTMTPGLPVGFAVDLTDLAGTLSGSNEAVVTMASGETVNGQATYVLNTAYASGRIKKLTSTQWSSK